MLCRSGKREDGNDEQPRQKERDRQCEQERQDRKADVPAAKLVRRRARLTVIREKPEKSFRLRSFRDTFTRLVKRDDEEMRSLADIDTVGRDERTAGRKRNGERRCALGERLAVAVEEVRIFNGRVLLEIGHDIREVAREAEDDVVGRGRFNGARDRPSLLDGLREHGAAHQPLLDDENQRRDDQRLQRERSHEFEPETGVQKVSRLLFRNEHSPETWP
jgi:hypothetical protein